MKEDYFGEGCLEEQAREFLEPVLSCRERKSWRLEPATAALLILDMQKYFLWPKSHAHVPSAPAIVPHIMSLRNAFESHHLPVIRTRHLNDPNESGSMGTWWREVITMTNPLSALIPEFLGGEGQIITKTQYDAFFNTSLDRDLKRAGVKQVVIAGVMTHLCCETTARSAFVRGYEVFFTVDGTATYNRDFHRSSLLNLAHGFAIPMLTSEVLQQLEMYRLEDAPTQCE